MKLTVKLAPFENLLWGVNGKQDAWKDTWQAEISVQEAALPQ